MNQTPKQLAEQNPKLKDGVLVPANNSFEAINEFVHNSGRPPEYEELQWALLGAASEIDRLNKSEHKLKSVEDRNDDLMVLIGRIAYCSGVNEWKRVEQLLKEYEQNAIDEGRILGMKEAAEMIVIDGNPEVAKQAILAAVNKLEDGE